MTDFSNPVLFLFFLQFLIWTLEVVEMQLGGVFSWFPIDSPECVVRSNFMKFKRDSACLCQTSFMIIRCKQKKTMPSISKSNRLNTFIAWGSFRGAAGSHDPSLGAFILIIICQLYFHFLHNFYIIPK